MTRACVRVPLGERAYDIHVGSGLLADAGSAVAALRPSSAAILTHPHLDRYAASLSTALREADVPVHVLHVAPGERRKNLATVARLYARLATAGLDRRGVLIALGGGVLGDIGGFTAATWLRGIDFVQVPTTLLAQVDASIGGKTGVDLPAGKNLVGAFHQPRSVWIDTDTLTTLPRRELRSGLAEVVKYGIIRDEAFFAHIATLMPEVLVAGSRALSQVIVRSCEIKADVVAGDEKEQGERAILNFGHTVGHAVETVTGYRRYRHGEAIAIGMVAACLVGERMGVTPPEVTAAVGRTLSAAGLPTGIAADLSPCDLLAAMRRDKKAVAGRLRFVLAERIGRVRVAEVPPDTVVAALSLHASRTVARGAARRLLSYDI